MAGSQIKSKRSHRRSSEGLVSRSRSSSSTHRRRGSSSGSSSAKRATGQTPLPLALRPAQGRLARLLLCRPQPLEALLEAPAHPLALPLASPKPDDAKRVDVLLALAVAPGVPQQASCVPRAPPRRPVVLVVDDYDVRLRLCRSGCEDRGEGLGGYWCGVEEVGV